ncbi:hypothetical protein P7K49_007477, partial [Saguinus oedipus]
GRHTHGHIRKRGRTLPPPQLGPRILGPCSPHPESLPHGAGAERHWGTGSWEGRLGEGGWTGRVAVTVLTAAQRILNRDLLNARSKDPKQGNPEPCGVPGARDLLPPTHGSFDFLQGDCTKAKQKLNWKPRVAFDVSIPQGARRPAAGPGLQGGNSQGKARRAGCGRREGCENERLRGLSGADTRGGVSLGESGRNSSLTPTPVSQELVREMVHADVELMRTNPNA